MDKMRKPKKLKQSKIRKSAAKPKGKKVNAFDKMLAGNRGGFRN